MFSFWLRWSRRDFRRRWVQIVATALILAGGVGAFAGLGGIQQWRDRSVDKSLAAARADSTRVDLSSNSYVRAGRLRSALAGLPAGTLAGAEERLVVTSQIDASRPGKAILSPARLIGVPTRAGGQLVDAILPKAGSGLLAGVQSQAVLDWNFAKHYGLPDRGRVRIAGLGFVPYRGLGLSPQYFLIVDRTGSAGAENNLAVVYLPLAAAQRAAGRPGSVNELLVRAAAGQDPQRVQGLVMGALRKALPGVSLTTTAAQEQPASIMRRQARNDQKIFTAFAFLLLAAAAFAAFNLVSRVVEAERREIGIGMALGAEPRALMIRPLALGLQIAVLGTVLGLPLGIGFAAALKGMLRTNIPLPVYAATFPAWSYIIAGLLGLAVPIVAALLPVRRAIGVQPVEAIRTGHRAATGAGASTALRRLSIPGRALAQLPLRDLARSPRQTAARVLGLSVVLAAVVTPLGIVGSVRDIANRERAAQLGTTALRLDVTLRAPVPASDPSVRAIAQAPGVARAETELTVASTLIAPRGRQLSVALTSIDPGSGVWRPAAASGTTSGDGIVIAQKAAADLGVKIGDTIVVRHPTGATGGAFVNSRVRVMGIHTNPARALAYIDANQAARIGIEPVVNTVSIIPRAGTAPLSLERVLSARSGVASVRPAAADADSLKTTVDNIGAPIQLVGGVSLALALLVAFTTTAVAIEARRREYATMFAFGLRARTGLWLTTIENLIIGVLATIVGLGLGLLTTTWIVGSLLPDIFPEFSSSVTMTGAAIATTLAAGIVAVTLAPLFTFRRMRDMNIPSTLRVME